MEAKPPSDIYRVCVIHWKRDIQLSCLPVKNILVDPSRVSDICRLIYAAILMIVERIQVASTSIQQIVKVARIKRRDVLKHIKSTYGLKYRKQFPRDLQIVICKARRKYFQHFKPKIGPEKGVQHLATAAIINALWDVWAKMEGKPLWKLLVDMDPAQLVNTIDFRYITDALTKKEAIDLLTKMDKTKAEREKAMQETGYPAYITSCGWIGYSDEKIVKLTSEALAEGYTKFKMKVGCDIEDDKRRANILRTTIGPDKLLMVDANQKWDVEEAIDWMKKLAEYKPYWIEEPTSPDDVLGHAKIAQELKPYGIRVATGEMCQNRVMFKQFIQAGALQFCQIDSCRLGGVNEVLAVILMAAKYEVPVCPHSGGVALCELVQHYAMFDYIRCSGSLQDRMTEYVDHLHEHMKSPCVVEKGNYKPPMDPGFLVGMKEDTLSDYEYPEGNVWQKLFQEGLFVRETMAD